MSARFCIPPNAAMAQFDGYRMSMPINRRHWVYAWLIEDRDRTLLQVYRSTWLPDDGHRWLAPVRGLINSAEVVDQSVVDDPDMAFSQAERTLYQLLEFK